MEKTVAANPANYHLVQKWLKKRVRIWLLGNCLVLIGLIVAEVVLLAVTAWFIFMGLLFCYFAIASLFGLLGLHIPAPFHSLFLPLSTGLAVILMFVSYFRNGEVDFGEIQRIGFMSNPANPNVWLAGAKVIVNCFYSAPRLAGSIPRLIAKSCRLYQMSVKDCASILTVLASADHALTYREIFRQIANLNPVIIFPQLSDIDGVLFLAGTGKLTLTPDLRAEIRSVLGASGSYQYEFEQPDADDPKPTESEEIKNYQVLGVDPSISLDELKSAYRRLMKENHPDLVSKAGQEELKALAEERTKQINEAYQAILSQRNNAF